MSSSGTDEKVRIVVASANPVKAGAIQGAFERHFPDRAYKVELLPVSSWVPDQPISDDETKLGALNRLAAIRRERPDADLWAALEGGVHEMPEGLVGFAWIVVASSEVQGMSRTATFPLPERVAELIRGGMELGHVNDQVFGLENSKQKQGAIGSLSDGLIDRRALYEHAAIFAMIPVKKTDLFGSKS